MIKSTIYYNPKCSKSREALNLLNKNNVHITVIEYLKFPLKKDDVNTIMTILGVNIDAILRENEDVYKNLNLKNASVSQKIDALSEHSILLQRPIVIVGQKGIVARPPELLLELLK